MIKMPPLSQLQPPNTSRPSTVLVLPPTNGVSVVNNLLADSDDAKSMDIAWMQLLKLTKDCQAPALIVLQEISNKLKANSKHKEDFLQECEAHWANITNPRTVQVLGWVEEYSGKLIHIGINDELVRSVVFHLCMSQLIDLATLKDQDLQDFNSMWEGLGEFSRTGKIE